MFVLALTLAALVVPPFFAEGFRRRPAAAAFLDGFVLVAITAVVVTDVLPAAFESAGGSAIAAALVGLAVPSLAERMGLHGRVVHGAGVVVGQFALLVHAAFDGVALGTTAAAGPGIAAAVVLHQVPVGLSAWLSMHARLGVRAAVTALAAMSLATVAGFFLGGAALASSPPALVGVLAGLSAGTLLHVVGHASLPGADRGAPPASLSPLALAWRWSGVGGAVALAGLAAAHAVPWFLDAGEHAAHDAHDAPGALVRWGGSLAGPYLVGTLLQAGVARWAPSARWLRAAPLTSIALVAALLGPAPGLALTVGVLVGRGAGASERDLARAPAPRPADAALVLGLGFAAAIATSGLELAPLPPALHVALGLALVQLPLPPTTVAVLAGALVHVGWTPAVAVATVVAGHVWPGGLRAHLRGTPRAVRASLVGGSAAVIVGLALTALLPSAGPVVPAPGSPVSLVACMFLGVWLVARLVARGPRAWIAELVDPVGHRSHAHDAHHHDHATAAHAHAHVHVTHPDTPTNAAPISENAP